MITQFSREFKDSETWRAGFAELIATMLFVFIGAGAVVVTAAMTDGAMTPARLLAVALAHGIAIMIMVSSTAKISGGHINPAVTIATMITRHLSIPKGIFYVAAQLLGAVIGALLIASVVPGAIDGSLGSHQLARNVSEGAGMWAEVIMTFVLVFVIFATAIDPRGFGNIAPIAIGLAVTVDILVGGPITGASMNPARSFGPALVSGSWNSHWVFWAGPIVGGALAGLVYSRFFMKSERD